MRKAKRYVITGWVGRDVDLGCLRCYGAKGKWFGFRMSWGVTRKRGTYYDWSPCEWPPKKVRVTVEEGLG
jgi:hypothetical protein